MNSEKLFQILGDKDVSCYCPECRKLTVFKTGYEVGCEDCGSHPAVQCEICGERFDSSYGYSKIIQYNKEIK